MITQTFPETEDIRTVLEGAAGVAIGIMERTQNMPIPPVSRKLALDAISSYYSAREDATAVLREGLKGLDEQVRKAEAYFESR